jgi:hypothetical protein
MKKQEDARLAILREYDRWSKDHPNDAKKMGGYVFFGHLEKERPDLLDFRAASKWQIVLASSRRSIERLTPPRPQSDLLCKRSAMHFANGFRSKPTIVMMEGKQKRQTAGH